MMQLEVLNNKIELGMGSSTGDPDFKGIQTDDIREWVRINDGKWCLIKYSFGFLEELQFIRNVDHLALKLSAVTGCNVFEENGKLSLGNFRFEDILK
jgi:hypothetical protein